MATAIPGALGVYERETPLSSEVITMLAAMLLNLILTAYVQESRESRPNTSGVDAPHPNSCAVLLFV